MIHPARARLLAVSVAMALAVPAASQEPSSPAVPETTEEIVERERIRAEVAHALEEFRAPVDSADSHLDRANTLIDRLVPDASEVAPFLAQELEADLVATFDFCAAALGRMKTAESEASLRRAVARAEEESGDRPRSRKAMALWALGVLGKADAIEMLDSGQHDVLAFPIHQNMSLLEAIAFQTTPESIPRAWRLAERFLGEKDREFKVIYIMAALRRIADPSTVPKIIELFEHPVPLVRREAARSLQTMGTPAGVDALVAALDDDHDAVRLMAAQSLAQIAPADRADLALTRLKSEEDPNMRQAYYRLLARALGEKAWEPLKAHWGPGDLKDRRNLVVAISELGTSKSVGLLRDALADPDLAIAIAAVAGLSRVGNRAAIDALIAAISEAPSTLLPPILRQLARHDARKAGPALSERLFEAELGGVVTVARDRSHAERLVDYLVVFRDVDAAPRLEAAIARQTDRPFRERLGSVLRRLKALKKNRSDLSKWIAASKDPDRELRVLAYIRLAEIGSAQAVTALEQAFGPAEPAEQAELLRAVGQMSPPRVGLVRRVLTSPEFDPFAAHEVREMAAHVASRIGGPEMFELLRATVERRNGRDVKITAYAALAGGQNALPLLRAYRKPQMQYLGWERGRAQEWLDRIAREIAAGRSLASFDLPPDQLRPVF